MALFVIFIGLLFCSLTWQQESAASGFAQDASQVLQIIQGLTEEEKVIVVNNVTTASIFLKCASADNAIDGSGSDSDDWWTLQTGQALGWGFHSSAGGRTCFWCYANNNDQGARDSGNWYLHVNVWGFNDCDGAPAYQPDITNWEIRDDGAYADDGDGNGFTQYSTWGPPPN